MYLMYQATSEGIGAQYQRIIALLGVAQVHNLKFIHQMITVGHNYNNDPLWNEKWDRFFNIKSIKHLLANESTENKRIMSIYKMNHHDINIIMNPVSRENIFMISLPFQLVDVAPNIYYGAVQKDIQKAYDESNFNRPLDLFNKDKINIAIHIRVLNHCDDECEIQSFENLDGRYEIHDDQYVKLINSLRSIYQNTDIHIFSQSNLLRKYKALVDLNNVYLHLDNDAMETFHHMCNANVLVIGKSSFSYLAGIYNKNKVIYIPFHHPPLDGWESIHNYIQT